MKLGYKQTEAGILPEDWNAKKLDSIARVVSGKRLPRGSSLVDDPTPFPYIRVTDMRPGTVSLSDIRYVPEDVYPSIRQYRIFRDDIFISVAGTLGIVGRVPDELDGANLTENADRITEISCSPDFLRYCLMSPLIQNAIDSIRTVGAQPKLALGRIRQFIIPLPPTKAEQRAIAAALSDVDALLDGLDRLIAKKRHLRWAAMQQLVSGLIRLTGYRGKWETKKIGEVTKWLSGGTPNRSVAEYWSGEIPWISAATLKASEIHESDQHVTPEAVAVGSKMAPVGATLLLVRGSALHNEIRAGLVVAPVCFNQDVKALVPSRIIVPKFLTYSLLARSTDLLRLVSTATNSAGVLDTGLVQSLEIPVPSVPEQHAIMAVLSDMDAEIAALEARRDKTRHLKQAMMQELLTGKTRLVKPDTANA